MSAIADTQLDKLSVKFETASIEDVTARHRKEKKELQAKIQALKKNAPKNDKKKRKEAMEEVARLEKELEDKHAAELKLAQSNEETAAEIDDPINENGEYNNLDTEKQQEPPQRISKAQKRRDKKAREAQEREKEILAAENDASAQFAPKKIELVKICAKLKEKGLALHLVNTDGDCLYNAIRHQLIRHGLGAPSIRELRAETANYILANKDALIAFMTHPKTGDLLNDDEFRQYCEDVRSTPAWGGQIELKALSSILKAPIEVLQADGPPTIQGADEFSEPNLTITYHRHMFSLGEHYNSTIPLEETEENPTDAADNAAEK